MTRVAEIWRPPRPHLPLLVEPRVVRVAEMAPATLAEISAVAVVVVVAVTVQEAATTTTVAVAVEVVPATAVVAVAETARRPRRHRHRRRHLRHRRPAAVRVADASPSYRWPAAACL